MAAVSALSQPRRRKQATYGKASRNSNAWDFSGFADDDDEEGLTNSKSPSQLASVSKVKEKFQVRKPDAPSEIKSNARAHALKPIKPREKKPADLFDVPSSDDEVGNTITRRSPQKLGSKRKLVDDTAGTEAPLAPWEAKKAQVSKVEKDHTAKYAQTAEAQLQSEIDKAQEREARHRVGDGKLQPVGQFGAARSPEKKGSSHGGGGAAARLKAKKLLAGQGLKEANVESAKRADDSTDTNPTPRKRPRQVLPSSTTVEDIAMMDAQPTCDSPAPPSAKPMVEDDAIFEFKDSNAGEHSSSSHNLSKKLDQQHSRRGKLVPVARRSSPLKMDSAPARLTELLSIDTDTTEDVTTRSPSVASSHSGTPRKSHSSPKPLTPETARRTARNVTPRQAELWAKLVPDDSTKAFPSVLPMRDLTLQTGRRTVAGKSELPRTLAKSSSDVGPVRRRTKLVDRLKASAPASAPSSDNDSLEDSDSEEEDLDTGDVEMTSDDAPVDVTSNSQASQTQSQTTTTDGGPRITYARTRSYLPEDSFEDGLLFSIPAENSQPAPASLRRTTTKSQGESQKSVFDMDESEGEDAAAGKLRTIHELRAGGGNQRFMDETSVLLDDIAEHSSSMRSRRRAALVELAKKMAEPTFLEKFYLQSFEQRLIAECAAPADNVADFALSTAFAMLLSGKAPEHVAQSLKESGVIPWLAQRLDITTDVKKMVKERANNMAKASQSIFTDFESYLCALETFWGELRPNALTCRTVALKALDNLVGRLRASGDRSSLATSSEVTAILTSKKEIDTLGTTGLPTDVTLSTSVLEALCTTGGPVTVPTELVERTRDLLVKPALIDQKLQRLSFLTLRLSLSLTNDNKKNCKLLAKPPTVQCLLLGIRAGFSNIGTAATDDEQRDIDRDLLVLSMGVMINLGEHAESARAAAAEDESALILADLVGTFQQGQEHKLEADSIEAGATNVAYGYLAVVLAILCRNHQSKQIIASKLPGKNLNHLVDAMEEFVAHHEKVDTLDNSAGGDGNELWSAFTQTLKGVLGRLKAVAQQD